MSVEVNTGPGWALVTAEGGNRRSRAARIAAWSRKNAGAVKTRVGYSETYGFQTQTVAHFELPKS
jgi:hypothetical protein